ncbi:GtrA family protein [Nocardia sp. NPDC060259]|uniref:GtrA family protein n=1 Tax=Nocardia sp. NPDC060259 TaxID=3347088 RepID=UPI00365753D2
MTSIAPAPAFGSVFVPAPRADWSGLCTQVRRFLLGEHICAQLLRFALVGGVSNIAYVLLFLACTDLGPLAANIAGSMVSTLIANELHRRLTFRAAGQVGWFAAQCQGSGLALAGLLISTGALAGLDTFVPGLGEFTQACAMLTVMAGCGGLRFLALRYLVF